MDFLNARHNFFFKEKLMIHYASRKFSVYKLKLLTCHIYFIMFINILMTPNMT